MSVTGLFLLPLQPTQTSPSSVIISHITRSFQVEPLPAFHVDHRLFADTSSLLPNADVSQRKYTHIATLSHFPERTFIGTSAPKDSTPTTTGNLTIITIPNTSTDPFTQLLVTKFQPQWAPRQSLVLDNGTSLSLKNGEWTVRIGDLRTFSRSAAAQGGGALRGMVIEVSTSSLGSQMTEKEFELMLRGFLDALVKGSGTKVDEGVRVMVRRTAHVPKKVHGADAGQSQDDEDDLKPDCALASLYMDMLRGSRT